ncbi:MAG: hypothetical protein J6033_02780 [Lachnospiraceae bacterium]|nr:hypothetical protein [Lachnospiraceae bacterium]
MTEFLQKEDGIELVLEALIIKANNSQNANFTDSYAKTTRLLFENGKVTDIKKEGYKYYNADGVLIDEKPDETVDGDEWKNLLKYLEGAYLVEVTKEENGYRLIVESTDEMGFSADSYRIALNAESVTANWDGYMNRVQR